MTIGIDVRLWNQKGVGRYIRNLVLNLQSIDKKNNYVLFAVKEDFEEITPKIFNPKWKIVSANVRWHTLAEQVRFLRILNNENLDLMHFTYISVPIFYKKPFVVTVHDLIPYHFSTGKASTLPYPIFLVKKFGYERVISNAVKHAKKIIVPLNAVKEDVAITFNLPKKKFKVTYEGYDANLASSKKKSIIDGKYFLYVGNAYPHKNLNRLLEAFLNLKKRNIKLVLVGEHDYFYKKLKAETKSKHIILFGKATDEELGLLYRDCLAVVQPSLSEGFGLPVLEAMVCKKLVICSEIESLKEVTDGNALFFNPKSILDIQKKLESYLEDQDKFQETIEKAYKRSLEFSWEKMAIETFEVYES